LQDISSERTEEATNARLKQNKHDRQIAELTLQLTRLQQQYESGATKDSSKDLKDSRDDAEVHDLKNQVKELSEEILKVREKAGNYSSEVSTLKSRLRAAIDRAEKAEAAADEVMAVHHTDSYDRMERAASPNSGNSMRRRGVKRSSSGTTSIRAAMHLNQTERVGKAIDALDSFSVSTGMFLLWLRFCQ
jgi:DNA repair exonuclease SbcCD ATPase subunit